MKKCLFCLILCLIIGAGLPLSALAVSATPNQKLAMRTGPNTKYTEPGSMPRSTSLTAIEYESGNGVTWVYVEFWRDGKLDRGYTGLKRMTVNGYIPWADHLSIESWMDSDSEVYSGPDYCYYDRYYVSEGQEVTLLRYEDGFAFIDFYDYDSDAYVRGWVPEEALDGEYDDYNGGYAPPGSYRSGYGDTWFYDGTLVTVYGSSAPLYETPYAGSAVLCWMPVGSVMSSSASTSTGHLFVNYNGYEGFVPKSCVTLY